MSLDYTKIRLTQPTHDYTVKYPQAVAFSKQQRSIFWPPDEIAVEKDIHDMKVSMTESEYHGVVTTLRLFTTYELFAGAEYWGDRIMKEFPRPDIQQMASAFSFFELNIHAIFYDKINKLLGLSTPEFYLGYVEDPVLKSRMDFIDKYVNHDDLLTSIGVFSMVEGAVLYSSFAFLKHFQNEGKNKLVNINAGIGFSVKDEALHARGAAWLFNELKKEMKLTKAQEKALNSRILTAAKKIIEHEDRIVDMIFEKGTIKGITELQMKNFVAHRVDMCLSELGIEAISKPEYNPIAKWFYRSIGGGQVHDFFFKLGSDYNRDWSEAKLRWIPKLERERREKERAAA